jgi:hypothetical protein
MRAHAGTLVLCALLAFSPCAKADAAAAPALSWSRAEGAESCVAGPELAKGVEAQLGREILVALPQAQLNVEGSVALAERGYHVHLRLSDPSGTTLGDRTLVAETDDCRALDPLLIFLIALMLDPDAPLLPPRLPAGLSATTLDTLSDLFGAEPSVPPLELARPAARPISPSAAPRAQNAATARPAADGADDAAADRGDEGWQLGVRVDGLAVIGLLPTPAGGVRLSLELWPSRALVLYGGTSLFTENTIDGNGAGFSLLQGELAVCPRLGMLARDLSLLGCARFAAGTLSAQVDGANARDPVRAAAQAGAGPELQWTVGAAAVHLGVTVGFPLLRDRFFLNGAGGRSEVFRMSQVLGQANLAVAVNLL